MHLPIVTIHSNKYVLVDEVETCDPTNPNYGFVPLSTYRNTNRSKPYWWEDYCFYLTHRELELNKAQDGSFLTEDTA